MCGTKSLNRGKISRVRYFRKIGNLVKLDVTSGLVALRLYVIMSNADKETVSDKNNILIRTCSQSMFLFKPEVCSNIT